MEVRISSGPGAGHVHRLGIGRATLGHGRHCTIRIPELAEQPGLEDVDEVLVLEVAPDGTVTITPDAAVEDREMAAPLRREPVTAPIVLEASSMSETTKRRKLFRRKKKVMEFQLGERIDPADAVPLVHLDRRPITGPTPWEPEQSLGVGPVLRRPGGDHRAGRLAEPEPGGPDPRLQPATATASCRAAQRVQPAPGATPAGQDAVPAGDDADAGGDERCHVLRHAGAWYTLLFAAAMPLMMLANASGSRRQQKKRYLEQVKEYEERRVRTERAAVTSLVGERGSRRRNFPDPATVLLFATGPRARLWERRPWDRDFLHLRIGTTDLPSDVTIKDPTREVHEGPLLWTAPDVPVTIPLREVGVVGIAGSPDQCRSVAMWAVAQVAALHSPSDTVVSVLLGSDPSPDWDWVKWLPHVRNDDGHPRPVRLATDEENRSAAISELMGEMEARRELGEKDIGGTDPLDRRTGRGAGDPDDHRDGVVAQGRDHDSASSSSVSTAPCASSRRSAARWRPSRATSSTSRPPSSGTSTPYAPTWSATCGSNGWPAHWRPSATSPPRTSRPPCRPRAACSTCSHLHEPDAKKVMRGWQGKGRTTQAVIGEAADGVFRIDIRLDGPHGLVAGTTGSGKSELLQTLIASLAVGNRPDEFNFVLVDYKGGAAFKDCNHLPHTVGMVTDLDGHLTTRALESLGAELRRREHQLADADAKDIEDYLAGRTADDEPMPRLLIVIDEFAALAAELPDFVTGLVDVARRGRSLGVHLILATQRPAGVVSAEIKSNTNLRIALRVTDAGDSDDVIESSVGGTDLQVLPGSRLRAARALLADPLPELAGRWAPGR